MIAADQVLADFIAGVQGKKFARILSLLEWADSSKVTTTSHSTHVCNSTPKVPRCPHEQFFSRFCYRRVQFSRFENNITPLAEGHKKHHVARSPHDAARGQFFNGAR